jgi:antitoxin ParD1/3/4
MNVSLGKVWEDYVNGQVGSGHFNNASEVVRDALRLQQERLLKLDVLRREVKQGVDALHAGSTVKANAASIISSTKAATK